VQTFLPYPNLNRSASVLDRQRLGKQRVENLQILKALLDPTYGWQNHPVVKMWRGYEHALVAYQQAVCREWTNRGYKDTCLEKSYALLGDNRREVVTAVAGATFPSWFGNHKIHLSHRSNLLRKFPEHYASLFEPELSDDLPYVWPESIGILTR
jgi:Pyrimidine dimer DNA glycosylase